MLILHVVEEFFDGSSATGFCVIVSLLDTSNCLLEILPVPIPSRRPELLTDGIKRRVRIDDAVRRLQEMQ
jgi:hypothetical protein